MRMFLLAAVTVMGLMTAGALFGETRAEPEPVSLAGLVLPGAAERNHSPLVKPAGYACRRDCKWCRDDCYYRFRINCYAGWCRNQFVLCMRACWYQICRGC